MNDVNEVNDVYSYLKTLLPPVAIGT